MCCNIIYFPIDQGHIAAKIKNFHQTIFITKGIYFFLHLIVNTSNCEQIVNRFH
ncbi:hypothetical protein BABA_11876 [Neobacillus bataviensis LMG 21833]|uniref:Uncharacterized protein n=1 Tax=Neobacillus bataviensis LMG 21833 TaxID=1117379 RepID=K6CCT8_9BACI|nr:hypothetical protein BABA_11876 [Neobacillus bataviensis LMG 21833]